MSERKRKSFTSQHKAKVALEAIRGAKTVNVGTMGNYGDYGGLWGTMGPGFQSLKLEEVEGWAVLTSKLRSLAPLPLPLPLLTPMVIALLPAPFVDVHKLLLTP